MEIAAEILAHYAEGQEHARLTSRPSLELLRTRVLLLRFLARCNWAPGILDQLSDPAQQQLILDKRAAGCRPS